MGADDSAAQEYVQPSKHEFRRSKQEKSDMINKLNKVEEENKEGRKKSFRQDMRMRHQSFLLSSFAPMKPIVQTREIETQTDSEPLKVFAVAEVQTDVAEKASIKVQTDEAEKKDSTMQTNSILKDSI